MKKWRKMKQNLAVILMICLFCSSSFYSAAGSVDIRNGADTQAGADSIATEEPEKAPTAGEISGTVQETGKIPQRDQTPGPETGGQGEFTISSEASNTVSGNGTEKSTEEVFPNEEKAQETAEVRITVVFREKESDETAEIDLVRTLSVGEEEYILTPDDLYDALEAAIGEGLLTKLYTIDSSEPDLEKEPVAIGGENSPQKITVWIAEEKITPFSSGQGDTWQAPDLVQKSPGVSGGTYSYPFDQLEAAGGLPVIADENPAESERQELFSVPAFLVDYKNYEQMQGHDISNGQDLLQFASVNAAIAQYHNESVAGEEKQSKEGQFKFPLYFGTFTNYSDIANNINVGGTEASYSTQENNQYAWEGREAVRSVYYFLNLAIDGSTYLNHAVMGIVAAGLGEDGALLSRDGEAMPYFALNKFLTNSKYSKVVDLYGVGDESVAAFPFRKETRDGDEWYVFDSASGKDNVRVKKDNNGRTQVSYNSSASAQVRDNKNGIGFFPLNDGGAAIDQLNYGFGMRVDIPFNLSADENGTIKTQNGQDVVFNFTGDDDVWVYVDGVLMLDLGGMHGKTSGSINFTAQTSTVDKGINITDQSYTDAATLFDTSWTETMGEGFAAMVQDGGGTVGEVTQTFEQLAAAANASASDLSSTRKDHTLTVFYMERGMSESNLKMEFNYTPKDLSKKNGLIISNTVDYSEINEAFRKELENRDQAFAYELWNNSDTDWNNEGHAQSTQRSSFALRNGEEQVYEETTDSDGGGSKIDGNLFTLYQSAQDYRYKTGYRYTDSARNENEVPAGNLGDYTNYDATDGKGNTGSFNLSSDKLYVILKRENIPAFTFPSSENDDFVRIDYTNVAVGVPLTITKRMDDGSNDGTAFRFRVTYTDLFGDGNTIEKPYTGSYKVGNTTKQATDEGVIELYAGESAMIEGVPVQSTFRVTELSSEGYELKSSQVNTAAPENRSDPEIRMEAAVREAQSVTFTNQAALQEFFAEAGKEITMVIGNAPTGTSEDTASGANHSQELKAKEANNWNWSGYQEVTILTQDNQPFHLVDGTNTVTIQPLEGDINIKKVTLEAVSGGGKQEIAVQDTEVFDYNASKPETGNYIAADTANGGGGNGTGKYLIGESNGQYCIGYINGSAVQFVFRNVSAGEYSIALDYCAGEDTHIAISVSGSNTVSGAEAPKITGFITGQLTETVSADTGSPNHTFRYKSKAAGDDTLTVQWSDGSTRSVLVHNYQVTDDIYVLDYGLPVDLMAEPNGIYRNDSADHSDTEKAAGAVKKLCGITTNEADKTAVNYQASGYGDELRLDQAGVKIGDSRDTMKYMPNKFMDSIETFYYGVQVVAGETAIDASNATPVMAGKVQVMPASVVYYEDNFADIAYGGSGTVEKSTDQGSEQSNDKNTVYGYDIVYDEKNLDQDDTVYGVEKDSDGTFTKLTYETETGADGQTAKKIPTMQFTFTGTGFDIVGRTTTDSAVLTVLVEDAAGRIEQYGVVDTYYANGDLYQIPVLAIRDLAAGQKHTVKISVVQSGSAADHNGCVFYMDGVRIYNSLSDTGLYEEKEQDATFANIHKLLVGTGNISEDLADGSIAGVTAEGSKAVLVDTSEIPVKLYGYVNVENQDGKEEEDPDYISSLIEYLNKGPNNEVYLESGTGIAFEVKGAFQTLQVEAKLTDIANDTENRMQGDLTIAHQSSSGGYEFKTLKTLTSRTAMYYEIRKEDCIPTGEGYLVILAAEAPISLSNLKYTDGCTISVPEEVSGLLEKETPEETVGYTAQVTKLTFTMAKSAWKASKNVTVTPTLENPGEDFAGYHVYFIPAEVNTAEYLGDPECVYCTVIGAEDLTSQGKFTFKPKAKGKYNFVIVPVNSDGDESVYSKAEAITVK